ncbi:MAG: amidohydrolase [Clostridia bacterium]|nr:amidohydrolase [Clostridia bacterium]
MLTLYENAEVFTGTSDLAECFVAGGGRFLYAGDTATARALYPDAHTVDLGGAFVCPGFNDSHLHLLSLGTMLAQAQLAGHTQALSSVLRAVADFADAHPKEKWILGRGWNQDYFSDACRYPNRYDLDRVCPDKPCLITRACGHVAVANSAALALAGIAQHAPEVKGGRVFTDPDGMPNGILAENAIELVASLLPPPNKTEIKSRLCLAMAHVNRFGVTSVHSDDFSSAAVPFETIIEAYQELKAEGRMTVRVTEQCLLPTLDLLNRFLERGYITGWGDEWFRIGPLKLLTDGSLGARTAFLQSPYSDLPDTSGIPIYNQAELDAIILRAHSAGMQIAAHAIGDAAAEQVLQAIEKASALCPRENARHGIVHCQVLNSNQVRRMRALNMHAYIQPVFLDYDTQIVYDRLGSRADDAYPCRSFSRLNVTFSSGSDCPVEQPDVLKGIQCAVTRKPVSRSQERPYLIDEALSVSDALRSFTLSGAYAGFEEALKGCIAAQQLADFTILELNPLQTSPDSIHLIRVCGVYTGGKKVY